MSRDTATSNFYPQNPLDQCSAYLSVGACGFGTTPSDGGAIVFNELNRYVYSLNNPLNFYDPSGNGLMGLCLDLEIKAPPVIISGAALNKVLTLALVAVLAGLLLTASEPPNDPPGKPSKEVCKAIKKFVQGYKNLWKREHQGKSMPTDIARKLDALGDKIRLSDVEPYFRGSDNFPGHLGPWSREALQAWCGKYW